MVEVAVAAGHVVVGAPRLEVTLASVSTQQAAFSEPRLRAAQYEAVVVPEPASETETETAVPSASSPWS